MQLTVIYDPEQDLAATVDTELLVAHGPIAPGEQGAAWLREWISAEDWDWAGATPELLSNLFAQWLVRTGKLTADGPEAAQQAADGVPGPSDDSQAALAQHEAQNAGDGPPSPQPADADPTATDGPTPAEPSPAAATSAEGSPAGGVEADEPSPELKRFDALHETAVAANHTTNEPCPNCNGTGSITHDSENGPVVNTCGMCSGTGKVEVPA